MAWYDFLDKLIPIKSAKGARTITSSEEKEKYFKELALYTGISYIANTISKCEIKTYKNNEEVREETYFTMNLYPNENESSSQFWHKVVEKMYYDGEALVIIKNGKLYCADKFHTDKSINGNLYKDIVINNEDINGIFRANEVYIFKLDNKKVKELIDGIYISYGGLISSATKIYKKSNGSKFKIKMPILKTGDSEFNEKFEANMEEQLKKFIESEEAVFTEYEGYELTDMSSSKSKGKDVKDILELRKDIYEVTSQALNMPLSLLTGNITNINDIVKLFITFAIDPVTTMMSEEMTRKQSNSYEASYLAWKRGDYFKIDTSRINHIDILESADNINTLISCGFSTIDDMKSLTGMPELNTDFSTTHFITKNYDTIDNTLKGEDKTNEL